MCTTAASLTVSSLQIVDAIAEALDYAHDHGLLHRDLKPANILLTEPRKGNRRILLADFGIARSLDDISGLTAKNTTVGTVQYSAAEQLMDSPVDGRADQYSLAATAYHLLTGRPPFEHSNPAVVISHHLNVAPLPVDEGRPDLVDMTPVVNRALSKEPGGRFAQCQDFADALHGRFPSFPHTSATTLAALALSPKSSTPRSDVTSRGAPPRWHQSAVIALAVLAVVALLGGVITAVRAIPARNDAGQPSPTISSVPPSASTPHSSAAPPVLGHPVSMY